MTWRVYGKPYLNASELTDATVYQGMSFTDDVLLKAVRVWVIFYGNPTFTSLNMKLYSNSTSNTPNVLLYTSTNTRLKADLFTLPYAIKETYFEFDYARLRRETRYNFVLNATGYSGPSDTSHIAWRQSYPDPVNPVGFTTGFEQLLSYPMSIHPIYARMSKT